MRRVLITSDNKSDKPSIIIIIITDNSVFRGYQPARRKPSGPPSRGAAKARGAVRDTNWRLHTFWMMMKNIAEMNTRLILNE